MVVMVTRMRMMVMMVKTKVVMLSAGVLMMPDMRVVMMVFMLLWR